MAMNTAQQWEGKRSFSSQGIGAMETEGAFTPAWETCRGRTTPTLEGHITRDCKYEWKAVPSPWKAVWYHLEKLRTCWNPSSSPAEHPPTDTQETNTTWKSLKA
jgi:hypothetical protein